MKKHLGIITRIGFTLIGLWLASRSIDFQKAAQDLAGANWWWIFAGFLLVNLSLVLRAYRWSVLLKGLGVSVRFTRLVELYFVGNFFNAFLPSGFGGDVVRVVEVAQDVPASVATGTVFVDRFTGLIMLFVMGLLALPFRPDTFPQAWTLFIATVCIGGLISSFILLEGSLIRRFGSWLPEKLSPTGNNPVGRVLAAVQGCGWRAIWTALAISAVFDLMMVSWWTAATNALGLSVSYTYNLLVVPIFAVALLLPSIGGLGIREAIAPLLYAGAGVNPSTAALIPFLDFIMLRSCGILGAPIYLYTTFRQRKTAEVGVKTQNAKP